MVTRLSWRCKGELTKIPSWKSGVNILHDCELSASLFTDFEGFFGTRNEPQLWPLHVPLSLGLMATRRFCTVFLSKYLEKFLFHSCANRKKCGKPFPLTAKQMSSWITHASMAPRQQFWWHLYWLPVSHRSQWRIQLLPFFQPSSFFFPQCLTMFPLTGTPFPLSPVNCPLLSGVCFHVTHRRAVAFLWPSPPCPPLTCLYQFVSFPATTWSPARWERDDKLSLFSNTLSSTKYS